MRAKHSIVLRLVVRVKDLVLGVKMKNSLLHTATPARSLTYIILGLFVFSLMQVAFADRAFAKYASYSAGSAYLSWGGANEIAGEDQVTPHGGYTQTTVKCAICHSTHRAYSGYREKNPERPANSFMFFINKAADSLGVWTETGMPEPDPSVELRQYSRSLLADVDPCLACHAVYGANSAGNTLIEMSKTGYQNPHTGGTSDLMCATRGCHGSVHGNSESKYAIVNKYNLAQGCPEAWYESETTPAQGRVDGLDATIDEAIASGNTNEAIGVDKINRAMKAYATGYLCASPGCHNSSSFVVATKGATNAVEYVTNLYDAEDAETINSEQFAKSYRTGHPSATPDLATPTCDGCHDAVGVATGTTLFPHGNMELDVYRGRYDETQGGVDGKASAETLGGEIIYTSYQTAEGFDTDLFPAATNPTGRNRVSMWMTTGPSASNGARRSKEAHPIFGNTMFGRNLWDGACIKCHDENQLP